MARIRFPHLMLVCLMGATPALAGEMSDPATAHIPKTARFAVRVPSLDRIDQVAVQLKPVIQLFQEEGGPLADLGKRPPSELIMESFKLGAGVTVDRTKPIYLVDGEDDDEPYVILPSGAGVAWEGERTLETGQVAVLRGDRICVGKPADVRAEVRGATVGMAEGDLCVHVFLGEIVNENREDIEKAFAEAEVGIAKLPVQIPEKGQIALKQILALAKAAVFSVDSFDYALLVREGRLESEGLLRTSPRSGLRRLLAALGPGQENDLSMLLPSENLFFVSDSAFAPTSFWNEVAPAIDQKLWEGAADGLRALMGPAGAVSEFLTGRAASAFQMSGMMGFEGIAIQELTDGAQAKEKLAAYDPAAANKAIAQLGIPIELSFSKDVDSHGETTIHRMGMTSDNPQLGPMMMGAQSHLAVEGKYLVVATGLTSGSALKKALDRIRAGERKEGPHQAAMARLARKRSAGLSVNLGVLKPVAQMLPLFLGPNAGEAMDYINAFPDQFYMSTAVDFANGDIHWKGDWPLKELTELTQKVAEIALEKKAKADLEEDFD